MREPAIRTRAVTRTTPQLRRRQRLHAAATTIAPLIGTIVAIALAACNGIGTVELASFGVMYSLTLVGITVGLHRLGAHRAFRTGDSVRMVLFGLGAMAGQGPLSYWVANHRRHHALSDRDGDLHSPHVAGTRQLGVVRGLWHSHVGWNFDHELSNVLAFCKDLLRDPVVARVNRAYYPLLVAGIVLPAIACGVATRTVHGAVLGLLWGGAVRLFVSYHATAAINSIAHRFGARPHDTRDESRNNLWLVIPTFGDGWHNNHHAFPSAAFFGHEWWQLDIGAWVIRALEALGLATDVKRPRLEVAHEP